MFSPTYIKSARKMYKHIAETLVKTAKSNKLQVDYYFGRSEPIMRIKKNYSRKFEVYVVPSKFEIVMMSKVRATEKEMKPYRIKVRKAKSADFKFEFELYNTKTLQFAKKLINKVN